MKQDTVNKLVYDVLCAIFDEFCAKAVEFDSFIIPEHTFDGIVYAEDFCKNAHNRDEWNIAVQMYSPMPGNYLHGLGFTFHDNFNGRCYAIKVNGFECSFRFQDLPRLMLSFKRLAHIKGGHKIPEFVTDYIEKVMA